jgi:segregation and condensation protein B
MKLHRSIEAILMVVDEPVTETTLATILEQPTEAVERAIARASS